jgi:hypothetical protein
VEPILIYYHRNFPIGKLLIVLYRACSSVYLVFLLHNGFLILEEKSRQKLEVKIRRSINCSYIEFDYELNMEFQISDYLIWFEY